MKKILLVMCLFGLVGCQSPKETMGRIIYLKDSRTDLCYAAYHPGQNYGFMTNVPCSEAVLKAVDQDKVASYSVIN